MDRAQRAALLEAVDGLVRVIPTHPAVLRVQRVVTAILAKEESVQREVPEGAVLTSVAAGAPFDKAAYQREYMRKKRVEAKAARAAAKAGGQA